jgi:predicted peroxiredoxin
MVFDKGRGSIMSILIHVSSGPEQQAKYFSSFNAATYYQRSGVRVTMFFNGDGVNGLLKGIYSNGR